MQRSTYLKRTHGASDALEFELFFEAERRRLFRALYVMTGSGHEAEELLQDAFLRLWERWDRVSVMDDPVGYLYRAAMNLARSRVRRIIRAARVPLSQGGSGEPHDAAGARRGVTTAGV